MRMVTPQIRKVGEFVPPKENWIHYGQCLEHFFPANDTNIADKSELYY